MIAGAVETEPACDHAPVEFIGWQGSTPLWNCRCGHTRGGRVPTAIEELQQIAYQLRISDTFRAAADKAKSPGLRKRFNDTADRAWKRALELYIAARTANCDACGGVGVIETVDPRALYSPYGEAPCPTCRPRLDFEDES